MTTQQGQRRRGGQKGNRNAVSKHGAGLRGTFYLNADDLTAVDDWLASQGIVPDKVTRLETARQLLYAALRQLRDRQDEPPIII